MLVFFVWTNTPLAAKTHDFLCLPKIRVTLSPGVQPGYSAPSDRSTAALAGLKRDKRSVALARPQRALCVYLRASSPTEKEKRRCGRGRPPPLVERPHNHRVVVGRGFQVQRDRPVERVHMSPPFC